MQEMKDRSFVVLGPPLGMSVSGTGWVKHNVMKQLQLAGAKVYSVYFDQTSATETIRTVNSLEERTLEPFEIREGCIAKVESLGNFCDIVNATDLIAVGDPDVTWFLPITAAERKLRSYYIYIAEAATVSRFLPVGESRQFLDLKKSFGFYTKVIPSTSLTRYALEKEIGLHTDFISSETLLPPLYKWPVTEEAKWTYREQLGLFDERIFLCIANNNVRKRLDQVLLFFKNYLYPRGKVCDRLVIHTDPRDKNGYEIEAIIARLSIARNTIIVAGRGISDMEGAMSAANYYVSLPSAEGYGLPVFENLSLGRLCYHTDVGFIGHVEKKWPEKNLCIVEAPHEYFYNIGNQVWYSTPSRNHMVRRAGSGETAQTPEYTLESLTMSSEQYGAALVRAVS
jgi:glycosyltransferase involved in cell wall biosynthesis